LLELRPTFGKRNRPLLSDRFNRLHTRIEILADFANAGIIANCRLG